MYVSEKFWELFAELNTVEQKDILVALFMGNDDVAVTKYTSERPSV